MGEGMGRCYSNHWNERTWVWHALVSLIFLFQRFHPFF